MLKHFPQDKINVTKNALFFLSQAPTHHSFTFNSQFLYDLKHKFHLPKTVCEIFHFPFRFFFMKVYIFVRKTIEKPHKVLIPDLKFLSCNIKFESSTISA